MHRVHEVHVRAPEVVEVVARGREARDEAVARRDLRADRVRRRREEEVHGVQHVGAVEVVVVRVCRAAHVLAVEARGDHEQPAGLEAEVARRAAEPARVLGE